MNMSPTVAKALIDSMTADRLRAAQERPLTTKGGRRPIKRRRGAHQAGRMKRS
jgi:hypothetical protein